MKRNVKTFLRASVQASLAILLALGLYFAVFSRPRDGVRTLHVLTTNDVHGAWFDSSYTGGPLRPSLMAVKTVVDSVRAAEGRRNVLLLDAGDCLQGDNAPYYFNYVATSGEHLFPKLAAAVGYDAVVVGNHDIETGHPVYDRVTSGMRREGIPFLAGNALRDRDGRPYWPEYKLFRRAGLKVLVLGYTNANISAWLDREIWSGMHFESLVPLIQERADVLRRRFRPDVVIAVVHSGTGEGDGSQLESQGMDLFRSLKGVDMVVCSHDHRPMTACADGKILLNSGSKARYVAHGVLSVEVRGGKEVSRQVEASLMKVDASRADPGMKEKFLNEFEEVKAFTLKEIGSSECDLSMMEAFRGPCNMLNLIHTVQLEASGADVSFAAPLSQRGFIPAGKLIYNELFKIYPYENSLYKVSLTGAQIRSYLEYSYDLWIRNPLASGHVLKIVNRADPRFGRDLWSFVNRSYNFDSAAGLVYTVDVTEDFGRRVKIESLRDGRPFDEGASYQVVMTSYRASGGGDLLLKGAGVDPSGMEILERYPEIRELIYRYISAKGVVRASDISDPSLIGSWRFVPEATVRKYMDADMALLFRKLF